LGRVLWVKKQFPNDSEKAASSQVKWSDLFTPGGGLKRWNSDQGTDLINSPVVRWWKSRRNIQTQERLGQTAPESKSLSVSIIANQQQTTGTNGKNRVALGTENGAETSMTTKWGGRVVRDSPNRIQRGERDHQDSQRKAYLWITTKIRQGRKTCWLQKTTSRTVKGGPRRGGKNGRGQKSGSDQGIVIQDQWQI